ncbi:MAG TPA: hypothetical protein VMY39_10410 [Planctomycetota bacterium]|nr:hypothetical protein [Planctomycetota bacterium]
MIADRRFPIVVVLVALTAWVFPGVLRADEVVLFDFEDDADLAHWSHLKLEDKTARGADEPPVKIAFAPEHATRGKKALKLTFSGGKYPTVVCTDAPHPEMWFGFKTFRADVTAPRECAVVFRFVYEKTNRKWGWTENYSRTVKIARCEAGLNEVVDYIRFPSDEKALGKPVALEIYMLRPRQGESITVDNIRMSTEKPDHTTPFRERNPHYVGEDLAREANYPWYPMPTELKVFGEDLAVKSARELGDLKKHLWKRPKTTSLEEIETGWRKLHEETRKTHPTALYAVFRQGDKGCDPNDPQKVFAGWEDCYVLAHDPANQFERILGETPGETVHTEVFVHRRSTLWRVDFASIPKGSKILAARFLFAKRFPGEEENWAKLKPGDAYYDFSPLKPTLYVAMPVNRPWVEDEASGFEWARDRFWKETCGMSWDGEDPDILPLVLAYGGTGVNFAEFDFTRLVDYFVNGDRPNWGFSLACPSGYFHNNSVWTSETPVVKDRPALMVIYVPNE